MIEITCPHCQDNFVDQCLEHAQVDEKGKLVDPQRFYVCPTCQNIVDISDKSLRRDLERYESK